MILTVVLACGSAPAPLVLDKPPVEVRTALERPPEGRSGILVVRTEYDNGLQVALPTPEAPGLTFDLVEAPSVESLGTRSVVTQRFRFTGPRGHYEIPPVAVSWPGPDDEPSTAQSDAIFLDLETPPITVGEIADIAGPAPADGRFLWEFWLVGFALGAGLIVAFVPRRRAATVPRRPPLPPHLAALQAWEAVRTDSERSDEDKARELSVIFRRYAEAVLRFEATARTTSEILAELGRRERLPPGNIPRAKRLLRATDRVKFAEERPSDELLDELDADLRAFVADTRFPAPSPSRPPGAA